MNSRRLMVVPCRGNPTYRIVERKLCCAVQQIRAANDRFGSEAAGRHLDHVRFALKADITSLPDMSVQCQKPTLCRLNRSPRRRVAGMIRLFSTREIWRFSG